MSCTRASAKPRRARPSQGSPTVGGGHCSQRTRSSSAGGGTISKAAKTSASAGQSRGYTAQSSRRPYRPPVGLPRLPARRVLRHHSNLYWFLSHHPYIATKPDEMFPARTQEQAMTRGNESVGAVDLALAASSAGCSSNGYPPSVNTSLSCASRAGGSGRLATACPIARHSTASAGNPAANWRRWARTASET